MTLTDESIRPASLLTENDDKIEKIVLMNAWEDYALLWQILNEVQTAIPAISANDVLKATRRVVRSMISRGLIDVYRRENRRSEFTKLSWAKRDTALDTEPFWRTDDRDSVEIGVAVTKAGEEAYLAQK